MLSPAFRLSMHHAGEVVVAGHADWLEVLALASKHGYRDLFTRCTDFLQEQARERAEKLVRIFTSNSHYLAGLQQASGALYCTALHCTALVVLHYGMLLWVG